MGGEVEGDRKALLTGGEVATVEGVGFLGGGEAGVLADRPRLVDVHRRVRTPHERGEAGERRREAQGADRLGVEGGRHGDALRRLPVVELGRGGGRRARPGEG